MIPSEQPSLLRLAARATTPRTQFELAYAATRMQVWDAASIIRALTGKQRLPTGMPAAIAAAETCRAAARYVAPALAQRLATFKSRKEAARKQEILSRYLPEIRKRGGETSITSGSAGASHARDYEIPLSVADSKDGLHLLRCEGWRKYSRRAPMRRASLAYLVGEDDNGSFATRVAGTCETVADALDFLSPAPVRKARALAVPVLRQGDVWIIPARRDHFDDLPRGHRFDPTTRTLTHEGGHHPLSIPFPARAFPQRAYQMGRTGARGKAD